MTADLFNATVIRRDDLTEELAIVRIRPDSGPIVPFEPGQFCTLGLVMLHGVSLACDLAYRAELEQIAREDPSVIYIPTVTREPESPQSTWTGLRGRVHGVLEPETYQRLTGAALDPAHCHVLLCGNPAMITEAQAMLEARGFVTARKGRAGNIHFERYW